MAANHLRQDGVVRDLTDLLMGGVSAMFATLFTNPIEVVKTRLQLQGELKARGHHAVFYKNVPHGLYVIARTEGLVALQSGLPAMLGFQFFLNTFRYGLFFLILLFTKCLSYFFISRYHRRKILGAMIAVY